MNKTLLIAIVIIVLVGAGAFYGGMKYGQSKNPLSGLSRQNFQNLTPEQRQQFAQGNGATARGASSNFLAGEVISKDEKSLTVKMPNNSSKIVFFSASTTVSEMTQGSLNDIAVGKQITVSGQQDSDGSYTAQNIQIR